MKTLRIGLSVVAIVLLLVGYVASVLASFNGQAYDYGLKVDLAPVRMLALIMLVTAIVLALIPERGEDA